MVRHSAGGVPPPTGVGALACLEQLRRLVGLRFYRPVVLLRQPVRVTLNLAVHPSLSLHRRGWTLNLNRHGVDVRLAPVRGLAYRRRVCRWPWTRAGQRGGRDVDTEMA